MARPAPSITVAQMQAANARIYANTRAPAHQASTYSIPRSTSAGSLGPGSYQPTPGATLKANRASFTRDVHTSWRRSKLARSASMASMMSTQERYAAYATLAAEIRPQPRMSAAIWTPAPKAWRPAPRAPGGPQYQRTDSWTTDVTKMSLASKQRFDQLQMWLAKVQKQTEKAVASLARDAFFPTNFPSSGGRPAVEAKEKTPPQKEPD